MASNTELKLRYNGGYNYDVFILKGNTLRDSLSGMRAFLFYSFFLKVLFFIKDTNRVELCN